MAKYEPNQRIKFAYKLEGWSYENGSQSELKRTGEKVLPSEYTKDMEAPSVSLARISHRSPASLADCAGYRHYRSFAAEID